MKILFWSTFALSLLAAVPSLLAQTESVDDFLGLESELLPELKGKERLTTIDLYDDKKLKVFPNQVEVEAPELYKGQGHSRIQWSRQDPEDWLSISKWISERELRDKTANWKIRLRQAEQNEMVGKILQCSGVCEVYRGNRMVRGQFLSQIMEGDEVRTDKNSVAWIFLMDGTLARISSDSSVSFNEIDIGEKEFFFLVRLNQGHLYWHPRSPEELPLDTNPETDSISLPLQVRGANQEFYERTLYQNQSDEDHLKEVINLDEAAIVSQVKTINFLKNKNNSFLNRANKVLVVAPNSSLFSQSSSFDFVYLPAGKSYLKKRSKSLDEDFIVHLRGYSDQQTVKVEDMSWQEVDVTGRLHSAIQEVPGVLEVLELLTKRIKSIELAREFWINSYTLLFLKDIQDPKLLIARFGYTTWGPELKDRINFLIEYTRRIETTHLRSVENLIKRMQDSGQIMRKELHPDQYQASLNHYLFGLKKRFGEQRSRVKKMTDLEYYVWILRHGKF